MKRLRRLMRRIVSAVTWPFRRVWAWWNGLQPPERVLYRALGLLAAGFALIAPALAFIVPGFVYALVFFVTIWRTR